MLYFLNALSFWIVMMALFLLFIVIGGAALYLWIAYKLCFFLYRSLFHRQKKDEREYYSASD